MTNKFTVTAKAHTDMSAVDLLASKCEKSNIELSKIKIKNLMKQGACWTKSAKPERIRKAKYEVKRGQTIKLFVDLNIQEQDMSELKCLHETHHYGVYYKPVGVLCQGTKYGDSYTILRELHKRMGREPFLIHRLDKETSGVMIIAYTKKGARAFSQQIKDHKIEKTYQAEVKGHPPESKRLESVIDGKEAILEYTVKKKLEKTSIVEVKLITGRKHQIRIQFTELGFPVMGDPRYGKGNGNDIGLQLVASKLSFDDPWRSGNFVTVEIPKEKQLF
ncbi:RNA pseudouridine synthase [Halobacteriovorax vibrionivorans]|uniref:RNA pseudouridine synthase n=1 Tax=Halobacteriovorax vibrionivorans TaxID=2152716 RepID=A0ABY0IKG5_9BACT|nr:MULTISPECIES: RNA pseudouridine synthase [Halobacteriovorax]RZF22351.1 RNA pseudouridine synthase [Halobacteriovorax vibrionivorans]TGD48603.1 RNA pseudouridine synthase [Halobacteriovorax sp. Y22]